MHARVACPLPCPPPPRLRLAVHYIDYWRRRYFVLYAQPPRLAYYTEYAGPGQARAGTPRPRLASQRVRRTVVHSADRA